jgi:hypothetical protein
VGWTRFQKRVTVIGTFGQKCVGEEWVSPASRASIDILPCSRSCYAIRFLFAQER